MTSQLRLCKLKLDTERRGHKMDNTKLAWELMNRVRGRIPLEQLTDFVTSFAYSYCNNNNLIGGNETELINIAEENLSRTPSDLKFDLEKLFCDFSLLEIKEVIYSVLFFKQRFMENTSDSLLSLSLSLLNIENDDTIFDLGSGLGTFLAGVYKHTLEKSIKIKSLSGVEINYNQLAISRMALEILTGDSDLKCDIKYLNIFTDRIESKYNKGFVYPPIGLRFMGSEVNYTTIIGNIQLTARNTPEWIFIDNLLSNLNGNKKRAVALISGRSLFNAADKEYRELLLNNGLIEGIIELPQGFIDIAAIKTFLIVFSTHNQVVKLLDASDYYTKDKITNNIKYNVDAIYNNYTSNEVKTKSIQELFELANWIPSTALLDIISPKNGVKLSEIANVFTGSQYTIRNFADKLAKTNTGYRLLTSSDIQDGSIDSNCLQSIYNDDSKLNKFAVMYNDVIITSKSSKIKIAVIDYEPKEKIIVTGGMIIVRPDQSKINSTYLKIFLESEQGQLVLKSIQKGMTIVTINAKELSEIVIPLPSIKMQFKMANKYNSKLSSLWALKSEISKIENDLKNIYYTEIEED